MVPEPRSPRRSQKRANDAVAGILRDRIHSGDYRVGEWLPTERVLTEDLRAHRSVVRGALALLEKEGLILRRPHCRPIVQPPAGEMPSAVAGSPVFPSLKSRFVALAMWHGGILEQGRSAQERIFWGMNQALGTAGYHAVFLDLGDSVRSETENAEREAAHLRYVLDHEFAGVVFYAYAYQSNSDLIREVAHRIPFILLDRSLPGVEADFVGAANRQAMFEATSHLISLGHRRIAYVTTPEPINTVQDRLQGHMRAMRESALHFEAVLTTPFLTDTVWPAFEAVFRLPAGERPTALLCVNDYAAIQVADQFERLNLRVPEDISLVGFDDIVQTLPGGVGLTSVAQPFEDIGRTAAELFIRRVENPSAPPAAVHLPTRLIVRESTAPQE